MNAAVPNVPEGMAASRQPRVLVVDDEEHITELVAMGLGYNGFDVERVATGRDALAAVGLTGVMAAAASSGAASQTAAATVSTSSSTSTATSAASTTATAGASTTATTAAKAATPSKVVTTSSKGS